jgi:hypothetical protein
MLGWDKNQQNICHPHIVYPHEDFVVIWLQHRGFEEVPCELTKRTATLRRTFATKVEAETKEREQKKMKREKEVDNRKLTSLRNANQSTTEIPKSPFLLASKF